MSRRISARVVGRWAALFALFVIIAAIQAHRCWHGKRKAYAPTGLWFLPISRAAKNAIWRATPAAFAVIAVGAIGMLIRPVVKANFADTMVPTLLDLLISAAFLFALPAWLAVMLINRPRFLVPPPYRHELGLIGLSRRRRSIKRSRLGV